MAGKDREQELDKGITPSQTVGPFFAYGLAPKGRAQWDPNGTYSWKETVGDNLVTPDAAGEKIRIEGCIRDGDGVPVNDAMIEIWQADAQGRYASKHDPRAPSNAKFRGFGRSATNKEGVFGFETIKPGAVPGPKGKPQAPHIVFCIFSRGMLRQIYTRMYFPDEAANASDPVLSLVPADRRGTLIAKKESNGSYRFDIRVQGENETVFFEV
ncbi:MAG: protocatechuate 3,4-dioxygenase subunit alpha [Pseudolabrys sp.]|nr:protocatechuate 3,4-dioxygenase subunit alpha [Pseudolabrys sp.]MBV9956500.1 protocatechuate 3,4-dioxygenase subunit alpha [Pseudolabrys sp.]